MKLKITNSSGNAQICGHQKWYILVDQCTNEEITREIKKLKGKVKRHYTINLEGFWESNY